jgi:thiol:disulfide interchange protein
MVALLLMTASLTACGKSPADEDAAVAAVEAVSAHRTVQIAWEKSWDDAFSRAKKEDKPVLVTFEAEWCVWCKKLESTTYRDSAVMSLIAGALVPVTLDVDGSGRELSDEHRVDGLPTILVLSPTGEERGRIDGYLPPGRFVEVMTEILQAS